MSWRSLLVKCYFKNCVGFLSGDIKRASGYISFGFIEREGVDDMGEKRGFVGVTFFSRLEGMWFIRGLVFDGNMGLF